MKWVLIIFLMSTIADGGVAITQIPFETKYLCEQMMTAVNAYAPGYSKVIASGCFQTMTETSAAPDGLLSVGQ